jgi:hypothetical protein
MTDNRTHRRIAFSRIAEAALDCSHTIVQRWLPDGKRSGTEWVSRNPTRDDRHPGSFKVNLATGAWADFATSDAGADLVSLAAYLFQLRQGEAALRVAQMLDADPYE